MLFRSPKEESDSLIVEVSELTDNPFGFGELGLSYLSSNMDIDTLEVIDEYGDDVPKRHVYGSYFRVGLQENEFLFYQREDGSEFLATAIVVTSDFPTWNGVLVGMLKDEVIQKLNNPSIISIPKYLILQLVSEGEYYSSMQFKFQDNKLIEVFYDGYLD